MKLRSTISLASFIITLCFNIGRCFKQSLPSLYQELNHFNILGKGFNFVFFLNLVLAVIWLLFKIILPYITEDTSFLEKIKTQLYKTQAPLGLKSKLYANLPSSFNKQHNDSTTELLKTILLREQQNNKKNFTHFLMYYQYVFNTVVVLSNTLYLIYVIYCNNCSRKLMQQVYCNRWIAEPNLKDGSNLNAQEPTEHIFIPRPTQNFTGLPDNEHLRQATSCTAKPPFRAVPPNFWTLLTEEPESYAKQLELKTTDIQRWTIIQLKQFIQLSKYKFSIVEQHKQFGITKIQESYKAYVHRIFMLSEILVTSITGVHLVIPQAQPDEAAARIALDQLWKELPRECTRDESTTPQVRLRPDTVAQELSGLSYGTVEDPYIDALSCAPVYIPPADTPTVEARLIEIQLTKTQQNKKEIQRRAQQKDVEILNFKAERERLTAQVNSVKSPADRLNLTYRLSMIQAKLEMLEELKYILKTGYLQIIQEQKRLDKLNDLLIHLTETKPTDYMFS